MSLVTLTDRCSNVVSNKKKSEIVWEVCLGHCVSISMCKQIYISENEDSYGCSYTRRHAENTFLSLELVFTIVYVDLHVKFEFWHFKS